VFSTDAPDLNASDCALANVRISLETARLKHDLTGRKFGRLFVISRAPASRMPRWICSCSCGNIVTTPQTDSLLRGDTTSCGCKNRENVGKPIHGLSKSNLYSRWQRMRSRCKNPNSEDYPNYGGRGINVCKSWDKNFMRFHKWAMENGFEPHLTIDRIDNDGDYKPSNCRWITNLENIQKRGKPRKKLCKRGHTFTADNTRWKTLVTGHLIQNCRTCGNMKAAEYRARKRMAA
jgi:hypothetical protein